MKRLYLIHGKPGSGKTTTSALAAKAIGDAYHFSIGEELRARALHGKPSRHQAELQQHAEALRQALPVPPHLATLVFAECVNQTDATHIIVDGYPQYIDRLPDFETTVASLDASIEGIYLIAVSDEIARQRLRGRSQRSNVTEDETYITKRLQSFVNNFLPTIEALSAKYPVHEIDGDADPEKVASKLVAAIQRD